tara:strand:+ start:43671 stop:45092 length:1422 start_codon:yes stop_codon:yes gene_type:complete
MLDVIVIGGGPAGYVAAIRCAQLGLDVLCVEKDSNSDGHQKFGGTCLNVGCIPSKALLDSSYKYYEASKTQKSHGIHSSKVSLDLSTMMQRKDNVVQKLTIGVEGLLKSNNVKTEFGIGKVVSKNKVELQSNKKTKILEARHIILASGSQSLEIPEVQYDHKNIVNSTGALEFNKVPKTVCVIGAGVIGLELGSVWSRLGSKVTILEALSDFLPMADKQISKESFKEFSKQGLDIKLGCKVIKSKSSAKSVVLNYEDTTGIHEETFDKVVVAVGRQPNTDNLFSNDSGIKLDKDGKVSVNEFCETDVSNIWAIGDLVRGPMLAHKATEEGIMVAERIAGKMVEINYDLIPSVIYTHPEIAWVGKNESELDNAGIDYNSGVFPFAASGRALAADDTIGFVKVIADTETDTILGVHAFGASAADILQQAVIAMEFGSSSEDLGLTIFSHPTLSEALHEAALAVRNQAIHIRNKNK